MNVIINDVVYVPALPSCADSGPLEVRRYVADLGRVVSLREYLHELLSCLWNEGEGFSGKRPFGNSGWDNDVYAFLVKAGSIEGDLDEDGRLNSCDKGKGNALMAGLLTAAFGLEGKA